MEHCDVLIIGGGPAGSTLAWKLRTRGLDTVILDASMFPREKVCAGWITPAVIDLLQIDEEYSRSHVLQPITGFKTGMMGRAGVLTRYDHTISYGIRRSEFDHYLLTRTGAQLRLGNTVRSLRREHGYWIINDNMKTPLVIGAGGHFCPISRSLRRGRDQNEAAVIAQETEFLMDEAQQKECQVRGDTPELYFCEDLKGYGWCVRKGNFLNIGLGREDNHDLTGHVRAFCDYLREQKKIPLNGSATFRGHAYRLYKGPSPNVVDDGVMLVGDAAGLAYPKSGEGIRPAVESAVMAAEVILSAAGDYRRKRLAQYPVLLSERFGKGSGTPGAVRQSITRFMGRRLMGNRLFSRHILLNRWFLNNHRPALSNCL
jgi:geranylgeranyl reductase family protein